MKCKQGLNVYCDAFFFCPGRSVCVQRAEDLLVKLHNRDPEKPINYNSLWGSTVIRESQAPIDSPAPEPADARPNAQ